MIGLRRFTAVRPALRSVRLYSSEGDQPLPTGSPDSFGKREKANEDWYIRQHEKDLLEKLAKQVKEHELEIEQLKKNAGSK